MILQGFAQHRIILCSRSEMGDNTAIAGDGFYSITSSNQLQLNSCFVSPFRFAISFRQFVSPVRFANSFRQFVSPIRFASSFRQFVSPIRFVSPITLSLMLQRHNVSAEEPECTPDYIERMYMHTESH